MGITLLKESGIIPIEKASRMYKPIWLTII